MGTFHRGKQPPGPACRLPQGRVSRLTHEALLQKPLSELPLVFVDIETTGLDYAKDHIIEVAALAVQGGAEGAAYCTLIKPIVRQGLFAEPAPIPKEITRITGLEASHLETQPVFEDVCPDFLAALGSAIVVAHNASFDVSFLAHKLQSLGRPLPTNPVLDTLQLSRAVSPELKSHSMDALKGFYGIKTERAHRALDDTRALVRVFDKILSLALRKHFADRQARGGPQQVLTLGDLQQRYRALMPFAVSPQQQGRHGRR